MEQTRIDVGISTTTTFHMHESGGAVVMQQINNPFTFSPMLHTSGRDGASLVVAKY